MKITRRDMLKFAIGSAAGIVVTPVPWKLLDDSAIWTQNWPWIPTPTKGNPGFRFTTCTLCPAACGVRARCVGNQPIAMSGIAGHPISHGALCPIGIGGHHLPYHPARATQPLKLTRKGNSLETLPITLDEAVGALASVITEIQRGGRGEAVAVLDQRPGRTLSLVYRQFLAGMPNGMYLTAPQPDGAMVDASGKPLGVDLENTQTILSFGVPILDGWGTPGRVMQLLKRRNGGGKELKLIQVESRYSRTAALADEWVPIKPGMETPLALGIANVLLDERLVPIRSQNEAGAAFAALALKYPPESVAELTGVNAATVRTLAREISRRSPVFVIAGGDAASGPLPEETETAIAGLNFLLGSYGRTGGIVTRNEIPYGTKGERPVTATDLASVPDHSIRLLILDGEESGNAFPWQLVEKKLTGERAMIVSLSPYLAGIAQHSHYLIPAPAYLESYQDVPSPLDATVSTFSVAVPLLPLPPESTDQVNFLRRLATAASTIPVIEPGSVVEHIKQRAEAIHKSGRGEVFTYSTGATSAMSSFSSPDQFWTALIEGACWKDSPATTVSGDGFPSSRLSSGRLERLRLYAQAAIRRIPDRQSAYPLIAVPFGWRGATNESRLSPLITKLYQESGLRQSNNDAFINPETAKAAGLTDGKQAIVQAHAGALPVILHLDRSVMPGVVFISVGPRSRMFGAGGEETLLSICDLHDDATWKLTNVKVSEA